MQQLKRLLQKFGILKERHICPECGARMEKMSLENAFYCRECPDIYKKVVR